MKSKIKGKSTKISSPFDATTHKTERSAVAVVMHWMRDIIEKNNIDLGLPDVETGGSDIKFPDTVIYKTRRSKDILCVMEFKPPFFDSYHEKELKEPAWEKARRRRAKYFSTSNFRDLILWDTQKVNDQKQEAEQIVNKYHLSDIYDLNLLEEPRFSKPIIRSLEKFLTDLYEFSTGIRPQPKLAIDEILVFHLQDKIQRLAYYYQSIIYDEAHKDHKFAKSLAKWFNEQGWSFFLESSDDYYKVARQTAYLLANKILFYNALQRKRPDKLDPLRIPEDLTKGGMLKKQLEIYFEQVIEKIDYETIYTTDFIDQRAFPDSREVVEEIKSLVNILGRYNFSTLGYDIIGRIFERLIPQQERHMLGQYFTNADVVDLILKFSLRHEDDKVLDPSCGAGTFLVRAYQHKKMMNQMLSHEKVLDDLWANDIAKFPAHLTAINLAIKDLSVEKNYPNVIQKDFFDLVATPKGFELPENVRRIKLKQLGKEEKEAIYPRWFDCIVGNPPYTRQEEISEISYEEDYKDKLIDKALTYGGRKIAEISKRAGIYVYFFIHGTKFLRDGDRFGFITNNSWLDTDYGKGLQEFFLHNYKIITIIESKVERWFEDADINTCIIILEKCKDEKKRNENFVRFVYLKKPLSHFIPTAEDIWAKEVERLGAIDKLRKTILAHDELYENEDLRIFPKPQKELWEESFDDESQKYEGGKWGKYLRAPDIFFKIIRKGKNKFVPLARIPGVSVRRGYIPWPYGDYLFDENKIEKTQVEDNYLIRVFHSTTDSNEILLDNPSCFGTKLLLVEKPREKLKGTKVLKYIRQIEAKAYKKPDWYNLGCREPYPIIWLRTPYNRHIAYLNQIDLGVIDHVEIESADPEELCLLLNSTLYALFRELFGRTSLGQGTLKTEVMDIKKFPALPKDLLQKIKTKNVYAILSRPIGSIFEEIGSTSPEEVSLDKVKTDRRELDKIVMGEILGLTDEEQIEVYQAVVDLVKSRIEKAKSFGDKKKTKEGIDIDAFVEMVLQNLGTPTLGEFYKIEILTQKISRTKKLPEGGGKAKIEELLQGWRIYSGKKYIECDSKAEARYLKAFIGTGLDKVKVPTEEVLLKILPALEKLRSETDSAIDSHLESIISVKTRLALQHYIWTRLFT